MGGGILQLICKGAQDVYLTENPEITFFRNIYYKYSNFSFVEIQLEIFTILFVFLYIVKELEEYLGKESNCFII